MESWMPFFVVVTALAIVLQAVILIMLFVQVRRTAAQVERTVNDLNAQADAAHLAGAVCGRGHLAANLRDCGGRGRSHAAGSQRSAESRSHPQRGARTPAHAVDSRRSHPDRRDGSGGRSRIAHAPDGLGARGQGYRRNSRGAGGNRVLARFSPGTRRNRSGGSRGAAGRRNVYLGLSPTGRISKQKRSFLVAQASACGVSCVHGPTPTG